MRADKSRVHATFRLLLLHTTLPCRHDAAFPRRAIIKTLGATTPHPSFSSLLPPFRRAKALAVVDRSHKEVILTLRFIRSKVYKGFIPSSR